MSDKLSQDMGRKDVMQREAHPNMPCLVCIRQPSSWFFIHAGDDSLRQGRASTKNRETLCSLAGLDVGGIELDDRKTLINCPREGIYPYMCAYIHIYIYIYTYINGDTLIEWIFVGCMI